MTEIFDRVEAALGTINPAVPFALAPYKGTLPDLYIVHQLIDGSPETHYDNVEKARTYLVQISIWNKSGLVGLPDVKTAMLNAGFEKRGERQLLQDQKTGHYGLAIDFVYLETSM